MTDWGMDERDQSDNTTTVTSGAYFPTWEELLAEDPSGYAIAVEKAIWDDEEGYDADNFQVVALYRTKEAAAEHLELLEQQAQIAVKLRQNDNVHEYRMRLYKINDQV